MMPKTQSAYRPFHSTETVLSKVYNDLLLAVNDGQVSVLCLQPSTLSIMICCCFGWETVRAACSSPFVVHEWQIVQSFVLWFHDIHSVHRVLSPPRFCPRSAVICLIHRWPGRSLRGTVWRDTRLPTTHSCISVSALSSVVVTIWRHRLYVLNVVSWKSAAGCLPTDSSWTLTKLSCSRLHLGVVILYWVTAAFLYSSE